MSQIRLYTDEDSNRRAIVQALRERGIDVITSLEANRLRYPDDEQLIWATEQGRVIYSGNVRDFYRLHTEFVTRGQPHAGILLMQQQRFSVGEQVRRILKLLVIKSAEQMHNQVEFLSDWLD
ncbi:MAG: DUF5615 family PIN-like protein [Nostoc sp.]